MHFLARVITATGFFATVLLLMNSRLPGFTLTGNFEQTLVLALIFTLLNIFVKPILTLLMGPVIILTLGLGFIIINVVFLFALDFLSANLTMGGILTYLYAAIALGIAGAVIHLATKK